MKTADLLLRALYFSLLLMASAAFVLMPSRVITPGVVFTILAVYAHAAARIIGVTGLGKAMLFLEAMPFFGFACVYLGKLEILQAFLVIVAAAVAGAAILAGEHLVVKGTATFTSSAAFIVACGLAGLGIAALPIVLFLGVALIILTIAGYGVARRVRG